MSAADRGVATNFKGTSRLVRTLGASVLVAAAHGAPGHDAVASPDCCHGPGREAPLSGHAAPLGGGLRRLVSHLGRCLAAPRRPGPDGEAPGGAQRAVQKAAAAANGSGHGRGLQLAATSSGRWQWQRPTAAADASSPSPRHSQRQRQMFVAEDRPMPAVTESRSSRLPLSRACPRRASGAASGMAAAAATGLSWALRGHGAVRKRGVGCR